MNELTKLLLFTVVLLLLLALGWVIYSALEAEMFEHLTGKHVSTWEAMFVDLRVQEVVRR